MSAVAAEKRLSIDGVRRVDVGLQAVKTAPGSVALQDKVTMQIFNGCFHPNASQGNSVVKMAIFFGVQTCFHES